MAVAKLLGDFFTRCALVIIGMLFPGYKSFKAVKDGDVLRQQKWLHYWLVFSIISTLMLVVEPLARSRVPYFNIVKIAVVAFLAHPTTAGYEKLYDAIVAPFLDQHMAVIDNSLVKMDSQAQEAAKNLVPAAKKYAVQARDSVTRNIQVAKEEANKNLVPKARKYAEQARVTVKRRMSIPVDESN